MRILALTTRLPYPPHEGHQLRTWHVLRALADAHEVSLLSFLRDDDVPAECGPLRAILKRCETFPIPAQHSLWQLTAALLRGMLGPRPFVAEKYTSASMQERIQELLPEIDAIHIGILPLMALIDVAALRVPLVLDAHNVEHLLLQQRATIEPSWPRRHLLRRQVPKLKAFEQQACSVADCVLACSRDDARELARLTPAVSLAIVPNGVDVEIHRPAPAAPVHPARLVFVGGMNWFPNRDGVQWFLDEIFPRILDARADAEFVLVGKADGVRVAPRIAANVHLLGFVEDLTPVIHAAAIYIVPLRAGSGTRLKVLEAMAYGMPIVTTRRGAEGITLAPGDEALFADGAEDFAEAVVRLIGNPAQAGRLGMAARKKAEQVYDWNVIAGQLLAAYAPLAATQRARQR
jgi:glycosyltransferase involved in cell wall biosynthesis